MGQVVFIVHTDDTEPEREVTLPPGTSSHGYFNIPGDCPIGGHIKACNGNCSPIRSSSLTPCGTNSLAVEAVLRAQHVHGFNVHIETPGPQAERAGLYLELMAPAGIVANQHFGTLRNQFTNFVKNCLIHGISSTHQKAAGRGKPIQ